MRLAITSALSRRAEEIAVAEGDSLGELMQRAGAAVRREAAILRPGGSMLVLAGPGNNGGDGWTAARIAVQGGGPAGVMSFADPDALPEPARSAAAAAITAGVPWELCADIVSLERALSAAGIVVDALFGVGLRGALREPYPAVVAAINDAGVPVVAVDVPTGVDSDSGALLPVATNADVTVTFGALKRGLLQFPAAAAAGVIVVEAIGLPAPPEENGGVEVWDAEDLAAALPLPLPDAHKGARGRLLVVAGSAGMSGAAVLASEGAQRSGAGYVTIAVPSSLRDLVDAAVTSAVTVGLPQTPDGMLSEEAVHGVLALASGSDAVVIGPGLGRGEATVAAIRDIVAACERPMVIDADALNAIAGAPGVLADRQVPTVLTPHPGEAARLLGTDAAGIGADRYLSAASLAGPGRAVVLKGARSVVACGRRLSVNLTGNPGMATTGTGDVLSGVIGTLLAQGLQPFEASVVGAYVHGRAGDRAAGEIGPIGLVAGDLVARLPAALRELLEA
jgi:ADP-dependent NAD(P)H-hydrate dehydratase / NAD(P)H-hydrate epimerase